MRLRRTFTYLVGAVSIAAATHTIDAEAATLSLVGSSTKICQLIGDSDWETGAPTAARTFTNFGLAGVDLGFPVDSGPRPIEIRRAGPPGTLYFLFGDSVPDGHPPGSVPPSCRRTFYALGFGAERLRPTVRLASAFSSPSRLQKPSRIQRCIRRSSRDRSTCRPAACS